MTDRPQLVNTYLRQNEMLVRFRLDASFDQQLESVRQEFVRAQGVAAQRAQSALDPLASPGRRKAGKNALSDEDAAFQRFSPRVQAKAGRVLLKQLELSPFWLRTWDAIAEARIQQGVAEPRLDRHGLIEQFDDVSVDIRSEGNEIAAIGRKQPSRRKQGQGLAGLHDALTPAVVPGGAFVVRST